MIRTFFSAAALVSVVAAGLSFPSRTQACPAPMPQTLLWLYQNSSEVHLATYSRSVDGGIESDEEGYSIVSTRQYFDISSTLKGEAKKSFIVDQSEYRSKRTATVQVDGVPASGENETEETADAVTAEVPSEEHDEEADVEDEGWMKPGSSVLLFLTEKSDDDEKGDSADGEDVKEVSPKKNDEKPELVLTTPRDGVRWIAAENIGLYEKRIKELNSIYRGEAKDRDHELIEWMIRCMEHRATRWDGAYELNGSFESLDRVEAAAEYEGDDESKPWVSESDDDEARFARLVTRSQMDRISNILMSPSDPPIEKGSFSSIADGESSLIDLVERWAGPDVAKFLLQRLRDGSLERYEAHRLATSISMILGGDELEKALESYGKLLWEDDDEAFTDDAEEEKESSDEVSTDESTDESPAKVVDKPVADESDSVDDDTPEKPRPTVKEVRAERLAAFIALADAVLASPEVQVEIAIKTQAAGRYK